jgi:O-antigen/teichoic acid export membrane protein
VVLVATSVLVGQGYVWRPTFDISAWTKLVREALPLAAYVAMGVIYFRLLIVLTSVLASPIQTGLFATSFRVVEILYGLSALIATTALPVLAAAAQEPARLGFMLQRLVEVAIIAAGYLVLVVLVLAGPVLTLLGGSQYKAAEPILQIQIFALVPVFVAHACQLALISTRRQSSMMLASFAALLVVIALGSALIPEYGGKGAAISAAVGESVFALTMIVLLRRSNQALAPRFTFVWKIAVAATSGACILLFGLPPPASATAASIVYIGLLGLTRAIPGELVDSLRIITRR